MVGATVRSVWKDHRACAAWAGYHQFSVFQLKYGKSTVPPPDFFGDATIPHTWKCLPEFSAVWAYTPYLGRLWWAPFLAGYLGLAGLVWLAWAMAPAVTLAGFLAASVLHFGLGDAEDGLAPEDIPRWVTVLTYGALPILLPVALHPGEAAPMPAALAQVSIASMQDVLRGAVWLLPIWTAAFASVVLIAWRERRPVAERLATAAGFALLPPLLAFGLYFGAGHSVRHVLRLGAWHDSRDPRAAARWLARVMLPAGLVCAAGLAGLALLGRDTIADVLAPCFRVIAALTLPHMVVTAWLEPEVQRAPRRH